MQAGSISPERLLLFFQLRFQLRKPAPELFLLLHAPLFCADFFLQGRLFVPQFSLFFRRMLFRCAAVELLRQCLYLCLNAL